MLIQIRDNAHFQEVINGEKTSMVMFGASWCGPCKMAMPAVEYIANTTENAAVCKVDIELNKDLAEEYGIMKVPSFLFFKNGEKVDSLFGSIRRTEMATKLNNLL